MLITSIEPIPISLPMRKPVIMAGEEVRRADNVLVRVATDNGIAGWGEAASAPTMTGETIESMVAAVHLLAGALNGREAADIDGASAVMHRRLYGNHAAKAAIEIALHDLAGKAVGRPVHALLGEKKRSRIALLGVIGGGDRDGDPRDACKVLGQGLLISADANQGYSVEEALRYVRAVEGCGLDFFEQPVAAGDLAGMAIVAAAADPAIGADEGIHSLDDIRRHHEAKAARGVSLKAIKLGGLRALAAAARLCDSLAMSVNISCKTGESSIACAAALHVACVAPNVAWGLTLTHGGLAQDVTLQPLPASPSHAEALDRPGLGVDVDEARVRRHQTSSAARFVA